MASKKKKDEEEKEKLTKELTGMISSMGRSTIFTDETNSHFLFWTLVNEFNGKKVKITIEEI